MWSLDKSVSYAPRTRTEGKARRRSSVPVNSQSYLLSYQLGENNDQIWMESAELIWKPPLT